MKSRHLYTLLLAATLFAGSSAARSNQPLADKEKTAAKEALSFLYRNMPLPDSTDHDRAFYQKQVEATLRARSEMPWGTKVPEREWKHFVLPVRVNNEDLDDSRTTLYEALKPRVKHLTMEEAVLEVNHWCHEHVTYQPSDARTHGSLASMSSAIGRCGEESTFTVAALRAVGIPARQVYTPRWAHTDDNHAWVEAWVDGKWRFLGACEPQPVLDLGWFNAPASRAMLMHTKAFGDYTGPERVMRKTACYTEIDVTDTYAPTAIVTVQTTDTEGRPVPATVQYRLYNYAEFFDLLWKATDQEGLSTFKSGLGDLLIWASDGERFGFEKVHVGDIDTIRIALKYKPSEMTGKTFELDVTPPVERNTIPSMTAEQVAENTRRMAQEDSIRNAYTATFFNTQTAKEWVDTKLKVQAKSAKTQSPATSNAITSGMEEEIASFLVKSRGNHEVITTFLLETKDKVKAVRLLSLINEKDLRDVPLDVLRDHYQHCTSLSEYILNQRVGMELLTPYRGALQKAINKEDAEKYRKNPALLETWCKTNITLDYDHNPQSVYMHPLSVWKTRRCDPYSRNIFFVAAARSLGIEARIDEVTGKVQWQMPVQSAKASVQSAKAQSSESIAQSSEWHTAFEQDTDKKDVTNQGTLRLTYQADSVLADPHYNNHFTISRLDGGYPVLLNYPECQPYSSIFAEPVHLDAGTYVLTTGTRLAKGGVLSQMTFFTIKAGEETTLPLTFRKTTDEVQVIGSFGSETLYTDATAASNTDSSTDNERSLLSTTGRGYYVIGLLSAGTEPTNHALNDLSAVRGELEKWGRPIMLICKDKDELQRIRSAFSNLPSTVHFGIDSTGEIQKGMKAAVQGEPATSLPVFLITDTFDRVVFMRQGYTIGLGDQLLKVSKGL